MLVAEPTQCIEQFCIHEENGTFYLKGTSEESDDHGTQAEMLCRLKYEIVTTLVRSHPDLLWFHAGAVADHDRVILFPGEGGQGKSTLVTSLCARGWKYLSEDVIAFDLRSGTVLPFPQTPRVRENIGRQLPLDQLPTLNKTEVYLPSGIICSQPLPIQTVIFPSYNFQSVNQLVPCSLGATVLKLLQNCMNFADHQHTAMRQLSDCLQDASAFCLSFSDRDRAVQLILEQCLQPTH